MTISSLKNMLLLFMTVCILGCLSGFLLYKNDIRIDTQMNVIEKSEQYATSIWETVPDVRLDNLYLREISNVHITRRIRHTQDIQYIDIFSHVDSVQTSFAHGWNVFTNLPSKIHGYLFNKLSSATQSFEQSFVTAKDTSSSLVTNIKERIISAGTKTHQFFSGIAQSIYLSIKDFGQSIYTSTQNTLLEYHNRSLSGWEGLITNIQNIPNMILALYPNSNDFEFQNILSYEPAAGEEEIVIAEAPDEATINPDENTLDQEKNNDNDFQFEIEDTTLEVEGVLVPQNTTVISSSRDGQIETIHFDNGDMFQKGDILIEYVCDDVRAEMEVAEAEKELSETRTMRNEKLLKLDIISDIEHLGFKTEDVKAAAQARIVEQRMEQCYIRAAYDGRVTNKLANAHEYTRTDRVLMEVASLDDLEVEFLLPSLWLRWVNVDAPISITVNETGQSYDAIIKRIYGEIDPVSQSIQMTAKLEPYFAPLLPGMSGTILVDVQRIRDTGIKGFLEQPRYAGSKERER